MALATRELTITYGGFSVGGSTTRQITEFTRDGDGYETAWVEFEFVTTAATAALFATEVAAVRAAYRTPRQDLTVTQESQTLLSLKQSDNTGFDANPEITKDGDPADTGRSRHFRVRIEFGRPADNVSTAGRRWSRVKIEYSPSRRRTVTISGTYTALSGTASLAQYLAQISAYATTVLNGVDSGATWERVGEPDVTRGETDKLTDFVVIYHEIIFNQDGRGRDNTSIVDPQLTITREQEAPGDSNASTVGTGGGRGRFSTGAGGVNTGVIEPIPGGGARSTEDVVRPYYLNVSYSCSVDYTVSTDLKALWEGTIRDFVISKVKTYVSGTLILLDERPNFGDLYENRFAAVMRFMAFNTKIIRRKVTATDTNSVGKVFLPIWDSDPYSFYKYQGPRIRTRTITEEIEEQTEQGNPHAILKGYTDPDEGQATGLGDGPWELISKVPRAFSLRTGIKSGGTTPVYIATITIDSVYQKGNFRSPSIANAGGITGGAVSGR